VSDYFALIEFTCVCFCEQATQLGFTKTLCPKKKKRKKKETYWAGHLHENRI